MAFGERPPLTDEDYAAAARNLGGTGNAFAPAPVGAAPFTAFSPEQELEQLQRERAAFTPPAQQQQGPLLAYQFGVDEYLHGAPAQTSAADAAAMAATSGAQPPAAPMVAHGAPAAPPPDAGRDIRTLGRPGEAVFKPEAAGPRAVGNAHVGGPPRITAVEGESDEDAGIGTTETVAAPTGTSAGGPVIFGRTGGVVPAGFDERNVPWRAGTRARLKEAQERIGEAEQQVGVGQRISAAEREEAMGAHEEQLRTSIAERERRYGARRAEIDAAQANVKKTMADAERLAQTKENFLEKHPGAILMGIGAIFGGISQGLRGGGPNEAMQALDGLIQRSIAEKKDEAARMQTKIGNENNIVTLMRSRFGEEQDVDTALEMAHRRTLDTQLGRLGEKAKTREQADAMALLREQNAAKIVELDAKFDQAAHHRAYALPGSGTAGGAAGATGDKDRELLVTLEDGRTIVAPDGKTAQQVRDSQVSVKGLESMANRIDVLRDDPESYIPFTAKNAELKELGASAVDEVRRFGGSGTLDQGFVNQAVARFGDSTDPTARFGQRFRSFVSRARGAYSDRVKGLGAEGVKRGYEVTPQGNLNPTKRYVGEVAKPTAQKTVKRSEVK